EGEDLRRALGRRPCPRLRRVSRHRGAVLHLRDLLDGEGHRDGVSRQRSREGVRPIAIYELGPGGVN
ncbi:hypothetical protein RFZ47_19700, partial [Acinetobacter baumannii]|nr:hypothetical protein [Acinetobacter baumannii]